MSSYIQKNGWSDFNYKGINYSLEHLNEYHFFTKDSGGADRVVLVTFTDHCFTKKIDSSDTEIIYYPQITSRNRVVSIERYALSMEIRHYIDYATKGKIWNVEQNNYAIIQLVKDNVEIKYGIVFSIRTMKGLSLPSGVAIDFHMIIETAYPITKKPEIITYGSIKFSNLLTLKIQRKHPKKNRDRNRPTP